MGNKSKVNTVTMEVVIARYFNWRVHLIIPNVYWGWNLNHEADLIVVTSSGYAWEIEIKTSASDLKRDKLKPHNHCSNKIKRLYFAIPIYLEKYISEIDPRAGILIYDKDKNKVKLIRPAKQNQAQKLTREERIQLMSLGCMRIWSLKNKIHNLELKLKRK